jgi:hypothetical protein
MEKNTGVGNNLNPAKAFADHIIWVRTIRIMCPAI